MAADDDDVTDNIPVPSLTSPSGDGPQVTIAHDGSGSPGRLSAVSGDAITVVTEASVAMDAQVEVSAGGVSSTGVVIWTRDEDGSNAIGIEILGGTEEWAKLR